MQNIILDDQQKKLWQEFARNIVIFKENRKLSLLQKIIGKKISTPQNLYIYSNPGSGKTMLMKKFYNEVEGVTKMYFHFNDFMRRIHQNLHQIRQEKQQINDELIESVKRVIAKTQLICFDEFQIHDIADAMLLGRIFSYFFEQKLTVIITSNTKPQELYKNGLQRELFLGFINKILLKNVKVVKFNSTIDYRLKYKNSLSKRYFTNENEFLNVVENLVEKENLKPKILKVWGRELVIKKTYQNIAIIEFQDLIQQNFAAADYQVICQEFSLIFLANLEKFNQETPNEARRFMLFIDEIYENKTALIISSHQKIEELYSDKKTNARVISRLNEIKSDFYFNNSKLFKNDKNIT